MDRQKALGLVIRKRRKAAGLSQQALADFTNGAIDQAGISRIEKGKQGMSPEVIEQIATGLKTRTSQLHMDAEAVMDSGDVDATEATAFQVSQALGARFVPLISWVEAGNFAEAVDAYARGTGQDLKPTSAKVGRLAYALQVHGHSMTNPRDELKSFPDGSVVIVDPHRELRNGALIVARLEDDAEATFKQYVEDAGRKLLVPLNPQYQAIVVDRPMTYCGTVVARAEEPIEA